MWPIQSAFRLRISCRIFLCSLTLSIISSFLTWSVQLIYTVGIRKDLQKQAWGAFLFSTHYRPLYWTPTPPTPKPIHHPRLFLVEAASLERERAASSEDNSHGILFFIDYWFRQLNTLDMTSWWSAMSSCFPCPVVSPHKTGLGWRTSSFPSLCTLMYSAWKFSVSV